MPVLDPVRLGQLAQTAQGGDENALSELLTQLHPKLYYTALKLTGNPTDAEDVTQDACLKLLDALPQLREPEAVLAWAERIVKNTCLNHLKRKQPYLFRDDAQAEAVFDGLPEENTEAVPDRYMEMAAKREIILSMIDALPEAQRLTVYLHYYNAHSVQEIAQLMGVSEGTVKSRLSAARANLKLQVEEEERKGNKLYLIFPLLGRLLREDADTTAPPSPLPVTSQQIASCAQQCAASTAPVAGETVAKSSAAVKGKAAEKTVEKPAEKTVGKTAAARAAQTAATKGGASLAVKVVAAVVAVALLGGAAVVLPRLFQGDEPAPGQETASPAPIGQVSASPAASTPAPTPSPEPTPEPSPDPTGFDPEAMIGQPLSALTDIAGEPNETDGTTRRWNGGLDYDFSVNLAEDGETIRELFVLYGPPVLGISFGDSAEGAQAALTAVGGPAGVNTVNTGGGQTSYMTVDPGSTRLYQFDCVNGSVIMGSIHDVS